MHDALRMDHHFDAFHLDPKQPARLDHLQPLIKERGRIDRDLRTHVPRRMFQRLLRCEVDKFVRGCFAKWPSGSRQNDPPNFRWTAIEALKDRVVLTVHRQNMHAVFARFAHHDFPRHHENFLARHCQIFPCFNRRQRGT